jgi:flavin reductase (DIM6/NTAB) family NADH-FMN oxidoreductase RutF
MVLETTTQSHLDEMQGAREFRDCMSRFATGVTVVTTTRDGEVHGMTANAFVSISIDPRLVLVSVSKRARMHAMLLDSRRYGLSVLAEDQEGLARHFAGRTKTIDSVDFEWKDGLPLVRHALAHVRCTVHAHHEAGDHTLFLGRVDDLDFGDGYPLVFFRGRFYGVTTRPEGVAPPALSAVREQLDALDQSSDLDSFPLEYYW